LKQYLALQSTYHTFVLFLTQYYNQPHRLTFSFHLFFCKTMNRSLSLRSAQVLTATTSPRTNVAASAPYLRALLLGGLAVLGSVGSAFAQDGTSVKVKQADAQALYMTVENPTQQRMQLQVVALDKHTDLVNEVNHKASYGTQLHFNGMPAGQYAVLLRVGRERYRYNVQVTNQPQTTISVQELTPAKPMDVMASTTR
jgi:hypothetical protein